MKKRTQKDYHREHRHNLRQRLLNAFGNKCIICKTDKDICIHEIHGKNHPKLDSEKRLMEILTNKKDYRPLCRRHHYIVHEEHRRFSNEELKQIVALVSMFFRNGGIKRVENE